MVWVQAQEQINDVTWREADGRKDLISMHAQIQALQDARQVCCWMQTWNDGPCLDVLPSFSMWSAWLRIG